MELSSNRSQINSNDFNLELRLPENENSKVRRSHSLVDSWLGKSCFEKYKTNGNVSKSYEINCQLFEKFNFNC